MPGLGKADEKLSARHTVIMAAVEKGVSTVDIAKALKVHPGHISRVKKKVSEIQLITVKRVKKALKSVDYLMDIDNYHSDPKLRPTDVLRAAEIVLNRSHPTVSTEAPRTTNFTEFNLTLVSNTPQPIDITGLQISTNRQKIGLTDEKA